MPWKKAMNTDGYSVSIKELPSDDRPRERLAAFGPKSLSNTELLAILLGGGFQNVSAINLAQMLLNSSTSLLDLAGKELDELTQHKGIGEAKACTLMAAFEIGRRIASENPEQAETISSPESAAARLMPRYGNLKQEHVGILALDTKNKVIKEAIITIGTLNGSMIHPREVFRPAIQANASSILLFHNHPSGDPTPSEKDIEVTQRLFDAGKNLGVELVDHLIVSHSRFISLKKQNLF